MPPTQPKTTALTETQTSLHGVFVVLGQLRKSWPLVLLSVLASMGVALMVSKAIAPVYEASALLQFEPNPPRPLSKEMDTTQSWSGFLDNHEVFQTQFKVATSERVLSQVVRDLSLQTDARFLNLRSPPAAPVRMEEATELLRGRLKVEPIKETRLFTIKYEDTNPRQARRICEAVARAFVTQNLDKTTTASTDAATWLSTQVATTEKELETNEQALQDFKRANELPSSSLEEVSHMTRGEMQQYDDALTHTRTRKAELLARERELAEIDLSNPDDIPSSELLSSESIRSVRSDYQQALKERGELLASGKGEQHPLVLAAAAKMAQDRHALAGEIANIRSALGHDLSVVEREETGEAALYESARKRGIELNLKEMEFHRLDRMRAQDEKLYGSLLEQMKMVDLARMMNVNTVLLVDAPLEPRKPVRPNVPLNLSIGALSGLALGILFMVLREQLDSSLRMPDDVEKHLGLVFLGLMPQLDSSDASKYGRYGSYATYGQKRRRKNAPKKSNLPPELTVHEHPLSGMAEAARGIRTNLTFMNPDRPFRKLLVTSAAPSEGKTTVACSIAIAFAQGGQRVCIIDCDLRRPRLHRIFDRLGDVGLTNALVGGASLDEVAKPTVVENLWSIPAGPLPPNPADILQSEAFARVIEGLAERFDRIIIDSPPLVAVTDSAIVSKLVDGTVFVIRAGETARHTSARGARALRDVGSPIIGAVLNAANLKRSEYAYYYRYYYYQRDPTAPTIEAIEASRGDDAPAGPPN